MIETERLILRRWRAEDLEPFAALNADPEVMRHFVRPLARAESDAIVSRLQDHLDAHGFGFAAVERRGDGAFLGMVGLANARFDSPVTPCVEIGWRLARAHWGRGYATEAAQAWLDHGFATLRLDEIVAFVVPENRASQAVMTRLRMVRDPSRDFDHPAVPEGHRLRPHLLFAIGRDAWADG